MGMPGFTAEVSLYRAKGLDHLLKTLEDMPRSDKILPQRKSNRSVCIVLEKDDFYNATGIRSEYGGTVCYFPEVKR